ncbi:MAG TPA: cell division protein SepF [Negativicutes bacterium]|jgi:cell division inhibitor SepF
MKFMEKVWGSLGLFEPVEGEEEQKIRSEEPEHKNKKNNSNIVNLPTVQKQMKVMVVEPFAFDDAQHVADHLRNRKPVVVNFENTDKEIAKRMIDFISGTTYALGGTIQKIGNNIFLCAPNNVDVAYSPHEEGIDKAFLPWGK